MATPKKWGSEFLVNTTTASNQSLSVACGLDNGRFVIAWVDESQSSGDSSILRAQVFNADGSKSGVELTVNTTVGGFQDEPTITGLTGGRFVVAWTDDFHGIRAQMFNADGSKAGGEILVSATPGRETYNPSVVARSDGGFIVVWDEDNADGNGLGAMARAFTSTGSPWSIAFPLNTTTAGNQFHPAIANLDNGGFVAVWTDDSRTGGDTSSMAIRAQVFSAGGHKVGGEILVNTTTQGRQDQPTIATLADGRFVVTWTDHSNGVVNHQIRGQVFNENGTKSGAEIVVSSVGSRASSSSVTALADGGFVVAWQESKGNLGDSSFAAIHAQAFDADGVRSGREFVVNTTTLDDQRAPDVTVLADGRFVVTWTDGSKTGGDTSGTAVRAQIFDPRESGIDLAGTPFADDFVGTRFADRLVGGGGDDRLAGGKGNDVLKGGKGADAFIFDTGLNAKKNVDKIADFKVGEDCIHLDNAIFKGIGPEGASLKKKFFDIGRKADDKHDRILYDKKKGVLFYDKDGSGKAEPLKFATLDKGLKLSADDFFVI